MSHPWQPVLRQPEGLTYGPTLRREALRLIADWLVRSQARADRIGCGYRDLQVSNDGRCTWRTPHSCTGERVNMLVAAHDILGGPYLDAACQYVDAMLNEPRYGICDGPDDLMRGACHHCLSDKLQAVYATAYSMRLPRALAALADATDQPRYHEWFDITSRHLLKTILPNGLVIPGFYLDKANDTDYSRQGISVRIGYMAGELAWLAQRTGDDAFAAACEGLVQWMARFQDADGAFPENVHLGQGIATSDHRSNHMVAYVLTGVARAARLLDLDAARDVTRRAADYLLREDHLYHRIPASPSLLAKRPDWALAPMYDGALALWEAGRALDEPAYAYAADRLAMAFIAHQAVDTSHDAAGTAPWYGLPCRTGYMHHPDGGWNCDGHSAAWVGWFLAGRDGG